MQYKLFTIRATEPEPDMEPMNKFLRSHKIVEVEKHLAMVDGAPCWTFCINYLQTPTSLQESVATEKRDKTDYRAVLGEKTFEVFSRMRSIRKQLAQEDAVPAYAVFTDAELVAFASMEELTEKQLQTVEGIGPKRVEKYGKALCERMRMEK